MEKSSGLNKVVRYIIIGIICFIVYPYVTKYHYLHSNSSDTKRITYADK